MSLPAAKASSRSPYFLFGRLKSGNLCGLRSTSIET
jgi:hypothetical protein